MNILTIKCELTLNTTARRLRQLSDPETVQMIIDKSVEFSGSSNSNSPTDGTDSDKVNTSDIQQNSFNVDSAEEESVSLIMIIIIIVAGIASIGLIIAFVAYTRKNLKNRK